MEVISSEFPDINKWFEAPRQPERNSPTIDVDLEMFETINAKQVTKIHKAHKLSREPLQTSILVNQSIKMVHQGAFVTKKASERIRPGPYSPSPKNSPEPSEPQMTSSVAEELKHVLDDLDRSPDRYAKELSLAKSGCGCRWTGADGSCGVWETCTFVHKMLGFSEVPSELYNTRPLMQRIMVVKQTTKGLVKLTETHQSFTAEQIEYIQKLNPHQQIKCIQDLQKKHRTPMMHEPIFVKHVTSNTVNSSRFTNPIQVQLDARPVNLPTPSPSPPSRDEENLIPHACPECSSNFRDAKALLKHKRNHHQVYNCKECGEKAIGYYKMASHSKRMHSKEPLFHCECGRNFGEKKGMTKHQNTCNVFKKAPTQIYQHGRLEVTNRL